VIIIKLQPILVLL